MRLASASPTCLFVVTEILAKVIVKVESDPDREVSSLSIDEEADPHLANYQQIVAGVLPFIFEGGLPKYTVNSCINVVSLCLKYCLMSTNRIAMLEQFLLACFPQYDFNVLFLNTLDSQVQPVQPSNNILPPWLPNRLAILTSLLEHIQQQPSYGSYFEYRRNMYTFKNNYLAALVHVTIWYFKVLVGYVQQPPEATGAELLSCMRATLKLFEELMCFPYTLHLQEYEC